MLIGFQISLFKEMDSNSPSTCSIELLSMLLTNPVIKIINFSISAQSKSAPDSWMATAGLILCCTQYERQSHQAFTQYSFQRAVLPFVSLSPLT